jgi:hypothetical protein
MLTNIDDIYEEIRGPIEKIKYADAKKHGILMRHLQAVAEGKESMGPEMYREMYRDPEYIKHDKWGRYNRRRLIEILRNIDTTQIDVAKIYDGPWSARRQAFP